jgi:hypothetical protein
MPTKKKTQQNPPQQDQEQEVDSKDRTKVVQRFQALQNDLENSRQEIEKFTSQYSIQFNEYNKLCDREIECIKALQSFVKQLL